MGGEIRSPEDVKGGSGLEDKGDGSEIWRNWVPHARYLKSLYSFRGDSRVDGVARQSERTVRDVGIFWLLTVRCTVHTRNMALHRQTSPLQILAATQSPSSFRAPASSALTTNMDSTLNLNTLAGSLPNSNLATAEKDLLNNFKGLDLTFQSISTPQADKECGSFVFYSGRP